MPRFIKFILAVLVLILLVVVGLEISGNGHVINAMRSTYLIGRNNVDIDNYKYFTQRPVKAERPQPWKEAVRYNTYEVSPEDSVFFDRYKTVSYLVVYKGEILFEKYWEGYSDSSLSNSFSMAKTIVSILTGMALEDGFIGSVDDKASDYLSELKGTDKENVTIEQLLQMTSGIGFDESYGDPFGFMAKAYYGDDIRNKTFEYPLEHEPGTVWKYLGGNTLLLSYLIEDVTGKNLSDYASEKLWKPLGAVWDAQWTYDEESGVERAYCCFYSNARDFAKLGELFLCQGNWKGIQLISPQWVEQSITPFMVPDENGDTVDYYGYQWWLKEINGQDISYMRGILGQYIFIIPEREMVVVRLGHDRSEERLDGVPIDVYTYLKMANRIADYAQ